MFRSGLRIATRTAVVVALLATTGLTGCFQMEYVIELEEDLSGEVVFDLQIDMERMAYVMASVQRQFSGNEGSPTDEEIETARAELLEQLDSGDLSRDNVEHEMADELPEGLELIDFEHWQDGLQTGVAMRVGFDDVARLDQLDVAPSGTGADGQALRGFKIVDEGDTFILRTEAVNPARQMEENAQGLSGVDELVEAALGDFRLVFAIEAPFDIVDHNATERSGTRLSWVYDYETLETEIDKGIFIRYRHPSR